VGKLGSPQKEYHKRIPQNPLFCNERQGGIPGVGKLGSPQKEYHKRIPRTPLFCNERQGGIPGVGKLLATKGINAPELATKGIHSSF